MGKQSVHQMHSSIQRSSLQRSQAATLIDAVRKMGASLNEHAPDQLEVWIPNTHRNPKRKGHKQSAKAAGSHTFMTIGCNKLSFFSDPAAAFLIK